MRYLKLFELCIFLLKQHKHTSMSRCRRSNTHLFLMELVQSVQTSKSCSVLALHSNNEHEPSPSSPSQQAVFHFLCNSLRWPRLICVASLSTVQVLIHQSRIILFLSLLLTSCHFLDVAQATLFFKIWSTVNLYSEVWYRSQLLHSTCNQCALFIQVIQEKEIIITAVAWFWDKNQGSINH